MRVGLFFDEHSCLSADCVYRTGIDTGAAVNTGIGVDSTLLTLLADSIHRAGIVTCAAVDALVGNFVCQDIHPLLISL